MKISTAAVVGAIVLLFTSASSAQGGNMMNGSGWGGNMMNGNGWGGHWMGGGYGWLVPVLLVVLIGVIVWAVVQMRK